MSATFSADDQVAKVAEAYSLDAIDFARANLKISLDGSDESIAKLEEILDLFHRQRSAAKPSTEQIFSFAKMFGSYLGEVFRKNHGGTWGIVTLGGESFPGMRDANGQIFWPWGRVQNRLRNGAQDNVRDYFHHLLNKS